jgi:hypothetical protein
MTFLGVSPAQTCFCAFPAGTQNKSTETCQIHQTKNDQSRKLVPIAPIHDTGDEYRIDGTSFVDWDIVYPSGQRREHNTLCHRIIAL